MSKINLTKLIKKAINKDQSAITQLYEVSNKKAYYIAISIMKNEEDAFDVLQNAYVKAFEKLDTLNNPEKFESWLGQIVSNECNMVLRKHKDVLFSELETEDGLDLSETFKDERIEFSPELNLDLEATKKIVQDILDKLPDEQRLVVLMFYFQDLSIKEIASILECSENTVKSRLNYAKKKIKSEVENLEKSGTKLYGIAPLPLFVWILKQMGEKTVVPTSVSSALTTTITTSIVNTTTAGATTIATKVALTLMQKIVIGIIVVTVTVVGGFGVVNLIEQKDKANISCNDEVSKTDGVQIMEVSDEYIKGVFYLAKELYDEYIYGREYATTELYFTPENNVIEKEGYYLEECTNWDSYEHFILNLENRFSENTVEQIIKQINMVEYNKMPYFNIREGVGDPIGGNYAIDAVERINETTYKISFSFLTLDHTEVTTSMFCVYQNNNWVIDGINFYG